MVKLCILASGSTGNCMFVGTPATRLLVDAGLSARETAARLEAIGEPVAGIQGICLTHEHGDHIAGLAALHTRAGLPLYANAETIRAICEDEPMRRLRWRVFSTGSDFAVGDLEVSPFSVPHDACDPVGFVIRAGAVRIGIVTDLGSGTQLVRERLRLCQVVIVEANHDRMLLTDARRPWALKQRIVGRHGHLSNADAAALLAEIAHPGLRRVYLTHLSQDCNRPALALETVRRALRAASHGAVEVCLTYADRASEVWTDAPP